MPKTFHSCFVHAGLLQFSLRVGWPSLVNINVRNDTIVNHVLFINAKYQLQTFIIKKLEGKFKNILVKQINNRIMKKSKSSTVLFETSFEEDLKGLSRASILKGTNVINKKNLSSKQDVQIGKIYWENYSTLVVEDMFIILYNV